MIFLVSGKSSNRICKPRKISLAIEDDLPRMESGKMTYQEWSPERWLTENGQIPEDDLPRMAKSGLRQAGISEEDLKNQQP
jgi:hypothetical protein